MKEIKLDSGAILKISHTPFSVSKSLYQAIVEEMKGISIQGNSDLNEMLKNLLCIGFSSKKIESSLNDCLKYCLYNSGKGDFKIDDSTFESTESRSDYSMICVEVALENVSPFMKGLYAGLKRVARTIINVPV